LFEWGRLAVMAVLFTAVLVYYYDASLWKPLYYGWCNGPVHWSLWAMLAGAAAGAAIRIKARVQKKSPPGKPGLQELWLILAVGAVSAHSLGKTPAIFNISSIGFPPGLPVIILGIQAAATFFLTAHAGRTNRVMTCACFTAALMYYTSLFHVAVDKPYVGKALVGAPSWLVAAFGLNCLLALIELPGGSLTRLFSGVTRFMVAGFLLLGLLATVLAMNVDLSFKLLSHTAAGAAMMLAAGAAASRKGGARPLFWVFGLGGMFGACVALLSVASAMHYIPLEQILSSQLHIFHTHPNITSVCFFLSSFVLLVLGMTASRPLGKAITFACALLCAAALALTHSRAGMLGYGAAIPAFFVLLILCSKMPRILRKCLPVLIPAGAALVLVACLFGSLLVEQFKGTLKADTIDFRRALWSAALSTVREHPLTGIGLGNYVTHTQFIKGRQNKLPYNTHPHSLSLHVAEGMGVPALLFLAGLFFLFLKKAYRKALCPDTDRNRRIFLLASASALLGLQVSNMFDQMPETAVPAPFWFFWGVIAALSSGAFDKKEPAHENPRANSHGPGRAVAAWLMLPLALAAAGVPALADDQAFRCSAESSPSPAARAGWLEREMLLNPFRTEASFQMALLYKEYGQIKKALEAIETIEEGNTFNAIFWDLKGQLCFKSHLLLEASEAFDRAMELDTSSRHSPRICCNAAMAFHARGMTDEADDMFRRLFSTYPEESITYLWNVPGFVRQMLEAVDAKIENPDNPDECMRCFAARYLDELFGDPRIVPKDTTIDMGRFMSAAMAYHHAGESEKAIALIERCSKEIPEGSPRLQCLLGWLYVLTGRQEDGINELKKALPDSHFRLRAGIMLFNALYPTPRMKEGMSILKETAKESFDIHFKMRENLEARFLLAKGHLKLGNLDEAAHQSREAMFFSGKKEINPEDWDVLVSALRKSGRHKELLDVVLIQVKIVAISMAEKPYSSARFLDSLNRLAQITASLIAQERTDSKTTPGPEDVEGAASVMPDNLARAVFLALFHARRGMPDEACAHLERVRNRYENVLLFRKAAAFVQH